MLEAVAAELRAVRVPFFLEGGELLGAVRQQSLIGSNWAAGGLPLSNGERVRVFERDMDIGALLEHQSVGGVAVLDGIGVAGGWPGGALS